MIPFPLPKPRCTPPLDEAFRPAVLANQAFLAQAANGVPLVFGLARDDGRLARYETRLLPPEPYNAPANQHYAERVLKFLLWQRGGHTIYVGGPAETAQALKSIYSPEGGRRFDYFFMGDQVYQQPFRVIPCRPEEVPPENEAGGTVGRHLEGCRVGFDLGASDRKASAVIDGQVVYSEEVVWTPRQQADPGYHYSEIMAAIQAAASKMPRLDAVGGSSAGIIIDNRPMVASLFRSVPPERFGEVHSLFQRIGSVLGVPIEVINDGDVTALAGSMSLEEGGVLGIALGSSEAAGYVNLQGQVMGWLNELCFAPVDYSAEAAIDEWSGDSGAGSQYFSQQCVFRLAPRAGIDIPPGLVDADKLAFVQEKLEAGHPGAERIWQSMGVYLGYGLAHYADFYEFKHALILGRCTSGRGGKIMLAGARQVLETEFPALAGRLQLHLPDERTRRVGQAIAAASLPSLPPK